MNPRQPILLLTCCLPVVSVIGCATPSADLSRFPAVHEFCNEAFARYSAPDVAETFETTRAQACVRVVNPSSGYAATPVSTQVTTEARAGTSTAGATRGTVEAEALAGSVWQVPFRSNVTTDSPKSSVRFELLLPELVLEKAAEPAHVLPEPRAITYTLRLTNKGRLTAQNVVVIDLLPKEVAFVWASGAEAQPLGELRDGARRLELRLDKELQPGKSVELTIGTQFHP